MRAPPGNPVLLFYDGFERQAEESLPRYVKAEARRHLRFLWRTARRKHIRTGFYTWFFMLTDALRHAGKDIRINDFATARKYPDYPIGVAGYPSVMDKVSSLPNPRILGPGLYDTPTESISLAGDPRNRIYLQTCHWMYDIFEPVWGQRLATWFGGFDLSRFEDSAGAEKTIDVLIYDKIYFRRDEFHARTVERFLERLKAEGLSWKIIRYGDYAYKDYITSLRASRCMAFFAHSETQGMAYQECLAMNVPIFAWDEGFWPNEKAALISPDPIPCTSVPYFDERCGVRFKADDILTAWEDFRSRMSSFRPREFIAGQMTFARSAEAYLTQYEKLIPPAP